MNLVLPLHEISEKDRPRVGGKGIALVLMAKKGLQVPEAVCITTEAYTEYVKSTGLGDHIVMELYRKPFEEMRWEEIWDTSLRIRNFFSRTLFPTGLRDMLVPTIQSTFSGKVVSVRSSAPGRGHIQDIICRATRILCEYLWRASHIGSYSPRLGIPMVRPGPSLSSRIGPGCGKECHGCCSAGDGSG